MSQFKMCSAFVVLCVVGLLLIGIGCQESQAVASSDLSTEWSEVGCDMDADGDIEFDDFALYMEEQWLEE